MINALKNYTPRDNKYVKAENKMLKTFMKEEKKLLKGLKTKYFRFIVMKFMNKWKHQQQAKEEEEQEEKQKPTKDDLITLNKHITDEKKT